MINAYLNPIVNESKEKFNWGAPQVDSIIQFAQTNFDWNVSKTKSTLAPVLKKVSERTVSIIDNITYKKICVFMVYILNLKLLFCYRPKDH